MNDKIKASFDYNTLDYKWLAREYLQEMFLGLNSVKKTDPYSLKLIEIAISSFQYFAKYQSNLQKDLSLKTVTSMCTKEIAAVRIDVSDPEVDRLSKIFNNLVQSNRKLFKCYDCGTNARAMFLQLIHAHRCPQSTCDPYSLISSEEKTRMREQYLVRYVGAIDYVNECKHKLLSVDKPTVFIMSISVQDFGHVWVIDKQFIANQRTGLRYPRYHHYQSSLRSHLLIDWIERMDYGRYPNKSMDVEKFFADLTKILSRDSVPWSDEDHVLFAQLFAFLPGYRVTNPTPGFSWTFITY
jgi:hypothetical protein